MDFAAIDARRKALAVTQKDLCARAGINQTTYSLLKRGRRDGWAGTYRKLSSALDDLESARRPGHPSEAAE